MAQVIRLNDGEGVKIPGLDVTVHLLQGHGGGARLRIDAPRDGKLARVGRVPTRDRFQPDPEMENVTG